MKNNATLYGIIGLLAGIILTYVFTANSQYGVLGSSRGNHMENMMGQDNDEKIGNHGMNMTMEDMSTALNGKYGDDFDRTFISEMIDHHQGAIDMANLAKKNAKHDEIKQLADEIISAQTTEINQMKQWQQEWGY